MEKAYLKRKYIDINTTMEWEGGRDIKVNGWYKVRLTGCGIRTATEAMEKEAESLRRACEAMVL